VKAIGPLLLLLLLTGCAATAGWHFEWRLSSDPAITRQSTYIVGTLISCEVNDTTAAVRRCR